MLTAMHRKHVNLLRCGHFLVRATGRAGRNPVSCDRGRGYVSVIDLRRYESTKSVGRFQRGRPASEASLETRKQPFRGHHAYGSG
jgi:hypothetical protein